jgi:hypothetical protein
MPLVCWDGVSRDDARAYGIIIATGAGGSGGGCIWRGNGERGDEQHLSHSTDTRRKADSRRRAKEIALLTCLYRLEIDLESLGCLTSPAMRKEDMGKCGTQHTQQGGKETIDQM